MKKGFMIFGVLFLFLISSVSAVPSIGNVPNNITDGQSVVVSGSGFGVKVNTNPLIWDNFEDGSVDMVTTNLDRDDWSSVSTNLVLETSITRGSYAAKNTYSGVERAGHLYLTDNTISDGQKIYVSFWRRWDVNSWPELNLNFKWFRIWPESELGVNPDIAITYHGTSICGGNCPGHQGGVEGCSGQNPFGTWGKNDFPANKTWVFEEIIMQLSSNTDAADAIFRHYRDSNEKFSKTNIITKCTAYPNIMKKITIDGYNSPVSDLVGIMYEDDIYIDTTWQRVMLCDTDTWSARMHCEIQPPTAWADGSITINVNQGSFIDGEDVYLFVVDENGIASNGYLVTLGDGLSNCGDADADEGGSVSITELINYISSWKAGSVVIGDLITAIGEWKNGC